MNSRPYAALDGDTRDDLASAYGGNWEARGSYNSLDFVARIRPDIHEALEALDGGVRFHLSPKDDVALAFSTYIHENIHWWQHIGTTVGLMLSLLQASRTHLNQKRLAELLQQYGPVKPLRKLVEQQIQREPSGRCGDQSLNYVINNWHDLECYRQLIINPVKKVYEVTRNPYFVSARHAYCIAIGAVNKLIAATADRSFDVLPHFEKYFADDLEEALGSGSNEPGELPVVKIPPLGCRQILEGQARFSQLQYLYGARGGNFTFESASEQRMLLGDYVAAFKLYLELTGSDWPKTIDSPAVGLFLLICDVALSPSEGLILPMPSLNDVVVATDPGWRFINLCTAAKEAGAVILDGIRNYSAEEYLSISAQLSEAIGTPNPRVLAETVCAWCDSHAGWKQIAEEDVTFRHHESNLPIRVLLGRFQRYQRDKLAHPQFFCWPGMCMTALSPLLPLEDSVRLFKEHSAIFVDRVDRDVYPRIIPGRDEESLYRTFNEFYGWVASYELTKQWIVDDGEFEYDYGWLTSKYTQKEVQEWAAEHFKVSWGIHPDRFTILS